MNKLSKILVIAASLCLLVAVLAFAVSANTETVSGPFAVRNSEGTLVGYDTWDFAVAAAVASGNDIILNEDYTVVPTEKATTVYVGVGTGTTAASNAYESGVAGLVLENGENVTLDLNGKTLTQNHNGSLFELNGSSLTIKGGGTLAGVRTVVRANGAANFTVEATSTITINNVAHVADTQQGYFTFFIAENGSNMKFTGDININPQNNGTTVFKVNTAGEITFDSCDMYVDVPAVALSAAGALGRFLYAADGYGTTISFVNGSKVEMGYAQFFQFASNTSLTGAWYIDASEYLNNFPDSKLEGVTGPTADMEAGLKRYKDCAAETKLYVYSSDSSIICNDKTYYKLGNNSQGQFMSIDGNCVLVLDFVDTYFQAGGRAISGTNASYNQNSSTFRFSPQQMRFTNCDYVMNTNYNNQRYLFIYGNNVIWQGGSITGNASGFNGIASCGFFYEELISGGEFGTGDFFFYGYKFDDVETNAAFKASSKPADTDTTLSTYKNPFLQLFSTDGTNYTNFAELVDGELVKYSHYLTTKEPVDYSFLKVLTTASTTTRGYNSKYDGTTTTTNGTPVFILTAGAFGQGNGLSGTMSEVTDEFGQSYAKWDWTVGKPNTDSGGYINFASTAGNAAYLTGDKLEVGKYYTVSEWDMEMTRAVSFTAQPRAYVDQYKADGTVISGSNGAKYNKSTLIPQTNGSYSATGGATFGFSAGSGAYEGKYVINLKNGDEKAYAPGEWARLTAILEYDVVAVENHAIQAYSAKNTPVDGETATVLCAQVEPSIHLFVDGEYVGARTWSRYGYDGWVPATGTTELGMDGLRFSDPDKETGSVSMTNGRVMELYDGSYDLTEIIDGTTALVGYEIAAGVCLNDLPKMISANNPPVAMVGKTVCYTEAELADALSSLMPGEYTEVSLYKDLTSPINITGLDLMIKTNGKKLAGFYSEDKKLVDYTDTLGAIKVAGADADEIIKYSFQYGEMAPETKNAVVGSVLQVPDVYNPDSTDSMLPSVRVDKGAEGIYFNTVTGWTLTEGTEGDYAVAAGKTTVYPIEASVKAVIVKWDADANLENGYEVVKEYNPAVKNELGEAPELRVDVTTDTHESGWYRLETGYNPADIEAIDLTVAGAEYTVRSGQYIITYGADDYIIPMYVNITPGSFNRLNFYVPGEITKDLGDGNGYHITDAEGNVIVKNIKVVNVDNATEILQHFWVRNNQYEYTTIAGEKGMWSRYSIIMGGSPEDFTVRVSFQTADGQSFERECTNGIAKYSEYVMAQPTSERYSEEAKALVMNMVNYSVLLYNAAGEGDVMTDDGRYETLIADYPEYLEYYKSLTDAMFEDGSDIYNREVATLNTTEANNPTLAKSYFSDVKIKFTTKEPIFMFKYSDAAKTAAAALSGFDRGQTWTSQHATYFGSEANIGNSTKVYIAIYTGETDDTLAVRTGGHVSLEDKDQVKNYQYWVGVQSTYGDKFNYTTKDYWTMSDFAGKIQLSVYPDTTKACTYEYSLAAYINKLVKTDTTNYETDKLAEFEDELALTKAMYAYAQAAYNYKGEL